MRKRQFNVIRRGLGHSGGSGFSPTVGAIGDIDVETCGVCGGTAKVIACIEDPVVIKKILTCLEEKLQTRAARLLPDSRAPPQSSLFGGFK